jgi:hypothetical protein
MNIKGFLRLIGYYHSLSRKGQIEESLTTLLEKEEFSWNQEATKDFEKLKEAMCKTLVLAMSSFTKPLLWSVNP